MNNLEVQRSWLDSRAVRDGLGEFISRPVGYIHKEYKALMNFTLFRRVSNGGIHPRSQSGEYIRKLVAVNVEAEDRIQDIAISLEARIARKAI